MFPKEEVPRSGHAPFGLYLMAALALAAAAFAGILAVSDGSSALGGSCGEDAEWTFDDGLLRITGSGAIYGYDDPDDQPWMSVRGDITAIEIGEGITGIGNMAFYGCGQAQTVSLPGSLTSIDDEAFGNCTNLSALSLPAGLTSIGRYAFANCNAITSVVIPSGVTVLEEGVFWTCIGLVSATVPDSVTSVGTEAFCQCMNLADLYIGNGLTEVSDDAFTDVDLRETDGITPVSIDPEHLRDSLFVGKKRVAEDMTANGHTCSKTSDTYSASITDYDLKYLNERMKFDSGTKLELSLKDGLSVIFDTAAITAIGIVPITVTVSPVDRSSLEESVKELVGEDPVFDMTADRALDLGNGKMKVTVPFDAEGKDEGSIRALMIKDGKDSGSIQCTYEDGKASFETGELGMFHIASEKSSGGRDLPVWAIVLCVVAVIAVAAAAAVILIRKE